MITGAHTTLSSKNAVANRILFKEVLKLPCLDAGGGWLIFESPRITLGFSSENKNACNNVDDTDDTANINDSRKLFQIKNLYTFVQKMKDVHDVDCETPKEEPWGIVTAFSHPGGGPFSVYQPLHCFPSKDQNVVPEAKKVSQLLVVI